MKPYPSALVIDGDRPIRRLLRNLLESDHYRVFEAETAQSGMKEAASRSPDVIIMELSFPDMNGLAVLQRLREWNHAPILILSSRDAESDKVLALDGGANDYMTKPFGPAELLARLRVLQRSLPAEADGPIFEHGGLSVDVTARTVTLHGRKIELTPTEQVLFYTLLRHAGKTGHPQAFVPLRLGNRFRRQTPRSARLYCQSPSKTPRSFLPGSNPNRRLRRLPHFSSLIRFSQRRTHRTETASRVGRLRASEVWRIRTSIVPAKRL